jgi:curli biogenesis system outer membrane secretion channel CsgG
MKRVLISLALIATSLSPQMLAAQTKRSVTVENFDYSTVMTLVQSIFGTQVDIGQGINALLVSRITQDGKFTVVERRKVANIMKEQDFGASNRVKKGTGARIGQIRGADFTVMGDIVVFGRDDRRNAGGIGIGTRAGGGIIGGGSSTGKAVVVLAYRLVDNESSEVVASGEARGESKRTSKGGMAGFFTGGTLVGGGFSSNASNFGETIIGEAVMDAVSKLSADLSTRGAGAAASAKEVEIDALVADASGGSMTINAGSAVGIASGMKLVVYRKGKEIKDPATGEVLDVQTERIGELTISTVREKIAMGTYVGAAAKVGDVVRNN